ncbi:MAG: SRPBCC family protein [Solirubrobacterales bacterium]
MKEVSAEVLVEASLAETWDYYFEPRSWVAWSDGFGEVASSERYPEAGGTLRWRSTRAGRGEVTETVLEHHPRRFHRIAFSDPQSEGELAVSFEIQGEATLLRQAFSYRLHGAGFFGLVSDALFIRPQQRRSLERSLIRLKHEVEQASSAS